jgi:hypothetical protein
MLNEKLYDKFKNHPLLCRAGRWVDLHPVIWWVMVSLFVYDLVSTIKLLKG